MTKQTILIVEDEAEIREGIRILLSGENYSILEAENGEQALNRMSDQIDLVILDVMMPGISGLRVCEEIRKTSTVPILFLTAKAQESDKLIGLTAGGDDYLAKPFGVRELIARVRALLRRGSGGDFPGANHAITASGITLDEDAHTASGSKGEIDLTPREFELLASLMKSAGKVVSREDLLRDAWGWEYLTETKTVDTHIKRLRDKIESAGYDPGLVETVRGYGYRFKQ